MIKKRRFPKIFFGWWTVISGGILALWGYGYYMHGFSALFKPIASELGFSRAATSVPTAIGRFGGGFEGLLAGWFTDRYGPKWPVIFGVFLMGLSLILMNYVDSLWAFYVVWGVMLGTGVNISLSVPSHTAIANWFVKKRGLAMSIRLVIGRLSGTLVLPLIAWLITVQGWRMTCVIGGVVMWLIGFPLASFCLKRHRPEYYGLLPDGATVEEGAADTSRMIGRGVEYAAEIQEVEFTLRQALRTPTYWLLITANAGHGMLAGVILLHSVPLLTDMGIDLVKAAVIMGMMNAVSLPAAFIGGFLSDHIKKGRLRFLMGGAYFLQTIGITVFLLNQTIGMVYVFFLLYYFALGIILPLNRIMMARYFGRKAFGSIAGFLAMLITPVGVVAPVYAGWVYDTTGSYMTVFSLFAVLLAASAVLMSFIVPPKPPAQITDVRTIV